MVIRGVILAMTNMIAMMIMIIVLMKAMMEPRGNVGLQKTSRLQEIPDDPTLKKQAAPFT